MAAQVTKYGFKARLTYPLLSHCHKFWWGFCCFLVSHHSQSLYKCNKLLLEAVDTPWGLFNQWLINWEGVPALINYRKIEAPGMKDSKLILRLLCFLCILAVEVEKDNNDMKTDLSLVEENSSC